MKASAFAYAKPRSLAETFDLLETHGEGARLLAGGQSLIPSLNMRLAAPQILLDITALSELKGIAVQGRTLRVGALVTHAELGASAEVVRHVPLLAEAVPHIAHAAIRNRGTIGGSLALADPAAEYPACALALDAVMVLKNRSAERRVKAADFFKGLFETDLRPGELLAAVELPVAAPADRHSFQELTRRHGDYAIVGLAAAVSGGEKRLAYFGVGSRPVLARNAASQKTVEAAKEALGKDLQPSADLYNSAATKLHFARVLLERAWTTLSK